MIEYLGEQRPDAARFARLLLDDGGTVITSWGPVQMAVWHLEVRRGEWIVEFHSERGFTEPPAIGRVTGSETVSRGHRPLGLAVFAWARATGVPFRLDTPDDFDHDLVEHGRDALDWLDAGDGAVLDRVHEVWREYRRACAGLDGEQLALLRAEGVGDMEKAVRAISTEWPAMLRMPRPRR
ncbi:hypothetical protein [Microbacterium sp. 179-I 3D4 NHS]|uniref:hypothetical protein n=1 Tax=Microbacterium sp. 179-I 3D4 NHS TaxID=3142381 RepID=UPI00399FB2B7